MENCTCGGEAKINESWGFLASKGDSSSKRYTFYVYCVECKKESEHKGTKKAAMNSWRRERHRNLDGTMPEREKSLGKAETDRMLKTMIEKKMGFDKFYGMMENEPKYR